MSGESRLTFEPFDPNNVWPAFQRRMVPLPGYDPQSLYPGGYPDYHQTVLRRKAWHLMAACYGVLGTQNIGQVEISASSWRTGYGYILFISIDEAHRGKGLGMQFMTHVERVCHDMNLPGYQLTTADDNHAGMGLYCKAGMTRLGPRSDKPEDAEHILWEKTF